MCMVDGADGGFTKFDDKVRKARREHRCDECRRVIGVGEHYEYVSGIYDGGFVSNKTCRHCLDAREWLSLVCGGWLYCDVLEDLQEHTHESPELVGNWLMHTIASMRRGWTRNGVLERRRPLPQKTRESLRRVGAIS